MSRASAVQLMHRKKKRLIRQPNCAEAVKGELSDF